MESPDLTQPFQRLLPWIRGHFPQIETLRDGRRRVYLDNAAGTLIPRTVTEAMAEAALWANPQPGRSWAPGPETLRAQRRARALLRDFLNAPETDPLFFSESTTACLYKLREGLEPTWHTSHNLVVTDCDHFANISPWEWRAGWEVRRARMLPDGHLDLDHLAEQLDSQTRVVAFTQASNGIGTVLRLEEAIPLVRRRAPRARVVVDAVHGAPHLPIDVQALGADALAFSTYKLFGPNCGVLWLRPDLLAELSPYRVEPHTDVETLLEWGTLSNSTVSGITAALEYLQDLGRRLEPAAVGHWTHYPRERRLFKVALHAVRSYEQSLSRRILEAIGSMNHVTQYGIIAPERAAERVPTFAFTANGREDQDVEQQCWERGGCQVAAGSHYAASVLRGLGRSGVVRASFAHYNNAAEAESFAAAVASLQSEW